MSNLTKQYIRSRLLVLADSIRAAHHGAKAMKACDHLKAALEHTWALGHNEHIAILRGHSGDIMTLAATLPHGSISRQEVEHMVLQANTKATNAMMQEAFNRELL